MEFSYNKSIDINFILLYVDFEDGLPISVLRDSVNQCKYQELEIEKVSKKAKCFQSPIHHFHTPQAPRSIYS
jgi:hypothetical protein